MEEINDPLIDTTQRKWRYLRDLSLKEKVFLTVTLITIVDEMFLSIIKFVLDSGWSTDVIISIAVLIHVVFCVVYVIEGVMTTRPSEILILVCCLVFLSLLLMGNYITGHHDSINLIQMITALVGSTFLLGPGLYLAWDYQKSKRLVTLTVGERDTHQTFYMYLMASRDLFILQVQNGAGLIILASLFYRSVVDIGFIAVGLPFLVVWSLIGYYTLKNEYLGGTYIFFALCVLGQALVIYGIVFADKNIDNIPGIAFAVILSSIAYFITVVCVVICTVKLYKRFGSGMEIN